MTFEMSQDSCVLKGDFDHFKLLEESEICIDEQVYTRLCIGYENKVVIMDVEPDLSVVKLRLILHLPGFPVEVCFVGKQRMCCFVIVKMSLFSR